jgi:ribosomal protein S18 acetylase RimI-like enzyme
MPADLARSPLAAPAFRAERYQLPILGGGQPVAELSPVQPDEAAGLASRMCAIPPWSTYQVNPALLESLFRVSAGGAIALAARLPDVAEPVGVAVIRWPWLIGPYMQFLGLDPSLHGQGLGTRVLTWMETEAKLAKARNLWICAAGFNDGAQRLYERFGFETVAALDDLIKDGVPEILMRKRLT